MRKYSWLAAIIVVFAMLFAFAGCGGAGAGGGGSRPGGGGGNGTANAGSGETVNITFNPNGGTFTSDSSTANRIVPINKGAVVSAPAITRENYTLNGWNTAQNGTGTAWTAARTHDAATTYYAQWQVVGESVNITFYPNGGNWSGSYDSIVEGIPINGTVTLPDPAPTKANYTFSGWNSVQNGGTSATAWSAVRTHAAHTTYYAQWTPDITPPTPVLIDNYNTIGAFALLGGLNAAGNPKTPWAGAGTVNANAAEAAWGNGPYGWFTLSASGNPSNGGWASIGVTLIGACTEQTVTGTSSLRLSYVNLITGNRFIKYGYDSYDVAIEDRTELVIKARNTSTSAAGTDWFRVMILTSDTGNAELEYIFRLSAGDTWEDVVIPLTAFKDIRGGSLVPAGGTLEAVYYLIDNFTMGGGTTNFGQTHTNNASGITGALWIDSITLR